MNNVLKKLVVAQYRKAKLGDVADMIEQAKTRKDLASVVQQMLRKVGLKNDSDRNSGTASQDKREDREDLQRGTG